MTGRLGRRRRRRPVPGVRVVLDARPLQAPERAPLAAAYLDGLLGAFDAAPLAGESFAFLIGSDLDDPTDRFEHLEVVGRRQLPPTRLLRSGAMTVDPFLLRGAAVGSAWRAERGGAAGAVYHAVGRQPAPDRLGPAGRGHAPRPGGLGDPGSFPEIGRRPVRPAPARAAPARCRGGHRRQRRDGTGHATAPAHPA